MGDHLSGMSGQKSKQVEFLRSELDLIAFPQHTPPQNVDLNILNFDGWRLAFAVHAMAQGGPERIVRLPA